jgi:hypothetical protein
MPTAPSEPLKVEEPETVVDDIEEASVEDKPEETETDAVVVEQPEEIEDKAVEASYKCCGVF